MILIWASVSRQKMNVPRGERYELDRSVHAEANAIISASRGKMIGVRYIWLEKKWIRGNMSKIPTVVPCASV